MPSGYPGSSTSCKNHPDVKSVHRKMCNACACKEFYHKNRMSKKYDVYNPKYPLKEADYERMLHHQGGVCKICGRPETRLNRWGNLARLAVDHDHTTDEVRGLLCHSCNTALGLLQEKSDLVYRAYLYMTGQLK